MEMYKRIFVIVLDSSGIGGRCRMRLGSQMKARIRSDIFWRKQNFEYSGIFAGLGF